jgi:hypothetical protein
MWQHEGKDNVLVRNPTEALFAHDGCHQQQLTELIAATRHANISRVASPASTRETTPAATWAWKQDVVGNTKPRRSYPGSGLLQ